jgi:hypothetical protein
MDPSIKAIKYYTTKFPTDAFAFRNDLIRNDKYKDNYFLKFLELHSYSNGTALVIDTIGMENDLIQKIKTDIEELYFSGNDKIKDWIVDLFIYSIYRNGFNTNNKSLLQLFPTSIKKDLNGYVEFNNQYVNTFIDFEQIENYCELFFRHHPDLVIVDDGKLSQSQRKYNRYTKKEDNIGEITDVRNKRQLSVLGNLGVSKMYTNEVIGENVKNQSQNSEENDKEYTFVADDQIEQNKQTEQKFVQNESESSYMTKEVNEQLEDQKSNTPKKDYVNLKK